MPEDIADYLVTNGFGVLGQSLVLGRVPEQPPAVIVVNDTGGRPVARTHDGNALRYPRIQIIVRDADPAAARATARAIWALLEAVRTGPVLTIGARDYQAINPLSEVFAMTGDSSGRALVGCNYECWLGEA